ncbi:MAG: hypothetical protein EB048_06965, partial [Gammaproteobacteria bacterium]|nr:hypothetical protein [Gammaproteobacteria bacterium]
MTETNVIDIVREAMWVGALVAGPVLVVVLLVGVVVGIFQAATSINEMTLSFLPKLAGQEGWQENGEWRVDRPSDRR